MKLKIIVSIILLFLLFLFNRSSGFFSQYSNINDVYDYVSSQMQIGDSSNAEVELFIDNHLSDNEFCNKIYDDNKITHTCFFIMGNHYYISFVKHYYGITFDIVDDELSNVSVNIFSTGP